MMKLIALALLLTLGVSLTQGALTEGLLQTRDEAKSEDYNQPGLPGNAPGPQQLVNLRRVRRAWLTGIDDTLRTHSNDFTHCKTVTKRGKGQFKICGNSKGKVKVYTLKARKPKSSKRKMQ